MNSNFAPLHDCHTVLTRLNGVFPEFVNRNIYTIYISLSIRIFQSISFSNASLSKINENPLKYKNINDFGFHLIEAF